MSVIEEIRQAVIEGQAKVAVAHHYIAWKPTATVRLLDPLSGQISAASRIPDGPTKLKNAVVIGQSRAPPPTRS
jgi:hypothetical protein